MLLLFKLRRDSTSDDRLTTKHWAAWFSNLQSLSKLHPKKRLWELHKRSTSSKVSPALLTSCSYFIWSWTCPKVCFGVFMQPFSLFAMSLRMVAFSQQMFCIYNCLLTSLAIWLLKQWTSTLKKFLIQSQEEELVGCYNKQQGTLNKQNQLNQ